MDGFQGINNMNLEEDQGKNVEDNDNEFFIFFVFVNIEDFDFDIKYFNEDDDFIVFVKV